MRLLSGPPSVGRPDRPGRYGAERRPPRLVASRDLPDPWGQRRWTVGGHTVSLDELELALTSILRWFGDDFTHPDARGSAPTVQAWVARHGPPDLAAFIEDAEPAVRRLPYDWSLNDVLPAPDR